MPVEAQSGYFAALRETQQKYLRMAEESFAPVPILQGPYFENEVVGGDMLRRMADAIYGDRDPSHIFYAGSPQVVSKQGEQYQLSLKLPFTAKGDVKLTRAADELTLSLGNWRRNIVLPRVLAVREIEKASFAEDQLVVTFMP